MQQENVSHLLSRDAASAARKTVHGNITLEVTKPNELFEKLDAAPDGCRLLNSHAERFIVGLARQASRSAQFSIEVRLPDGEVVKQQAQQIREGIQRCFQYRADEMDRELRDLFSEGRRALAISLPILIGCLLLSRYIKLNVDEETLAQALGESLLILGWVANWKPIEIFLYEWWPVMRRRRLYQRLANATVRFTHPHRS